jgi:hypothetical protein
LQLTAQDSTKTLSFSGGVDAYTRYDFSGMPNNFTSFTNSQNSFELGMATIRANATALSGKVTATVDLGFGRRAEEFSYNDGAASSQKNGFISLSSIKQLFVTYSPSSAFKFTFGKFATHVGYEMVDAQANKNYSMSYMFTNGPFFHTGLKADFTSGNFGFMLGLSNYTDQSTATNNVRSVLGQVSGIFADGKVKTYLNYVGSYGSKTLAIPGNLEALSQIDLVVSATINDHFSLGYNGTVQNRKAGATDGNWWGSALYLNYDFNSNTGLCFRNEYISDSKLTYFTTENIFASTLSLNAKVGPLTIVPELRFESSQAPVYLKSDGGNSQSTFSGLLAVLYSF